jgi:hypothetical protein
MIVRATGTVFVALAMMARSSIALADPIAMDTPVVINGIDTACTGIADSKEDPRWQAYPVRIEFSNGGSQYLAGAHVSLAQSGKVLAELDCQAPWVLFKVPPGSYSVTATIAGSTAKPRTATFSPPKTGQKRIVLQFTDFQSNQ